MGLFDFITSKRSSKSLGQLDTHPTDDFVDQVLLELRSAANDAIKVELESRENQFMRAVLNESFFTLESLVVRPANADIARRFEEFLSRHESIDANFRTQFFHKVLQPEYRSARGSSVKVPDDFVVTVELSIATTQEMSQEEVFQVNLRGKPKQFELLATLSGPHRRESKSQRQYLDDTLPNSAVAGQRQEPEFSATSRPLSSPSVTSAHRVRLRVVDAQGVNSRLFGLPLIIGKATEGTAHLPALAEFAGVDAKYVSRQQLVITEILGQVYFYLPQQATLSALNSRGELLSPLQLHQLLPNQQEIFRLGVDPQQGEPQAPQGPPAEFAVLEISLSDVAASTSDGTPRPRASH